MDPRRNIPSVERVLEAAAATQRFAGTSRSLLAEIIASVQSRVRRNADELSDDACGSIDWYLAAADRELGRLRRGTLRRAINATGVVLHTNLGRAPLAREAVEAIVEAAAGYCTLEYDLDSGSRGSRHAHCVELLCRLTGAEDALVVNNNAAALVLALNTVANGRSVVISRGELIEIGGSFRIPEIIQRSGARLREVGTTNRTHVADYVAAIDGSVGAVLKVHPSNYRITGYAAEVAAADLARLCTGAGIPLVHDLGSGLLVEPEALGLPADEPTVRQAVAAGAALVTFSGDKLLGGPQCGVIAGSASLIDALRKNPLCRAVRVDKLTIAALAATLRLSLDPRTAIAGIPALRMIAESEAIVAERAARLCEKLVAAGVEAVVVSNDALVGGGAFPGARLRGRAVAIAEGPRLAARLRHADPAVIGRVEDDRLLLDARTIGDAEIEYVAKAATEGARTHADAAHIRPTA
jgi:L-seryl-tRNA(Ser) seleniumtransferase